LSKRIIQFGTFTLVMVIISATGCSDDNKVLEPAPFPTDPVVFTDEFGSGVEWFAFEGSDYFAFDVVISEAHESTRSLLISVPDYGDTAGSYAGGAFVTSVARDLTGYNALTFWAKADVNATLDVAGIGNDNTGTSIYTAEVNNLALSTVWQKFTVPLPLPARLNAEQGLFYYSEGPENGNGYNFWLDDIVFENLATISNPRPVLQSTEYNVETGDTVNVDGGVVTFDVDGTDVAVSAMPAYFTFSSSNEAAVVVDSNGTVIATGIGSSVITAKLGAVDATGSYVVNVSAPLETPDAPAPTPTVPGADVISLYSDAYSDEPVDSWSAVWDMADYTDEMIDGDNVKKYFNLSYAGIDFSSQTIDASGMTRFHMDIWTPNATAMPAEFKIKLVDFGANGIYDEDGGDDVEHELIFNKNSVPALETGTWVSIDMPLAAFSGLLTRGHLAQIIISGDLSTVYVDNLYFYDAGEQTAPTIPAPIPQNDPDSVISLFSDVYTDVPVDTWSAIWDFADVEDFMVGSDSTKKYTNLLSAGIEFKTTTVDASGMTHFHMNVWTPDATADPSVFRVKLVDFGPNGVYDGGGNDDAEDELTFDHTTMSTGLWVTIDVPLSSFSDLTTRGHLAQLIISGTPNTIFIDNVYFYDSGIPDAPSVAAPVPTDPPDSVVSLFSDAYTDVPVDTWSTVWDTADVQDYVLDSDTMKKYTNLLFAGIEFTSVTVDASAMAYFHMDVWTPDATNAPAVFKIKLVDFGANGTWDDGGADDVEHEITLDETTMNTGSWVSLDIPLTEFVNLTTRAHLAQLIISGDPNTVFIDNVYFHK